MFCIHTATRTPFPNAQQMSFFLFSFFCIIYLQEKFMHFKSNIFFVFFSVSHILSSRCGTRIMPLPLSRLQQVREIQEIYRED